MHWTSTGKRVTDPAIEQLDEWLDSQKQVAFSPAVRHSVKRVKYQLDRKSIRTMLKVQ